MKKKRIPFTRRLKVNKSYVADDLVTKLRIRMENNKDMNAPGRPLLYSERKDGVIPEGDPRTCKWQLAQEAQDYIAKTKLARRDAFDLSKAEQAKKMAQEAGASQSTQGPVKAKN